MFIIDSDPQAPPQQNWLIRAIMEKSQKKRKNKRQFLTPKQGGPSKAVRLILTKAHPSSSA